MNTNPLQTNNTITMIAAYAAGVLASKFPLFDSATWSTILLAIGGAGFTIYTAFINRKSKIVSTAADLPEVSKIDLDKTVPGASSLNLTTPVNVVLK